tara:strand:+ start:636 stop:782 length:147 start_codon:yes stop_codon:yes gene_type:complete
VPRHLDDLGREIVRGAAEGVGAPVGDGLGEREVDELRVALGVEHDGIE